MTDSEQLVQYPIPPVDAIEPPSVWEQLRQPLVEGLLVGGLREVRVSW